MNSYQKPWHVRYAPEFAHTFSLLIIGGIAFAFWYQVISTYYEIKVFEEGYVKTTATVDSVSMSNWRGVHYTASYHYEVDGVTYWGRDKGGGRGRISIIYAKSDPSVSRIRVLPPTWESWYGVKYFYGVQAIFWSFGLIIVFDSYAKDRLWWWRWKNGDWTDYFS